jgi:SAM-dependent methyltransferase
VPPMRGWILDFGCGDGHFCSLLSSRLSNQVNVVGFEPFMAPHAGGTTEILRSWEEVERRRKEAGPAQIVTCFETLEHFSPAQQESTLKSIRHILADDGHLLISVPVEGGFPSLVKNLLRRVKYGGATTYRWRNIGRALLWKAIPEARQGSDYLSHMGFYYPDLETILQRHFIIRQRVTSPFQSLGPGLNSQVLYVVRPRPSSQSCSYAAPPPNDTRRGDRHPPFMHDAPPSMPASPMSMRLKRSLLPKFKKSA